MALRAADHAAITELLLLHGHLVDEGRFEEMRDLFTPDVVFDISEFGYAPLHGLSAIITAACTMGALNPVGHHVTNIVLREQDAGLVLGRSKGINVHADGTTTSLTYEDVIARDGTRWRIRHRRFLARRRPLGAA